MSLLKLEIIENGFGNQSFPADVLDKELSQRVKALKARQQKCESLTPLEEDEILAILLYTHERQDLYVNLKTTMTGKGMKKEQKSHR